MKRLFIAALALLLITAAGFRKKHTATPYMFPALAFFPEMPVPASNPVTQEGADLGRYLFYDPVLSADSNLSCGSCHRQEAAFSDAPKPFSKGAGDAVMKRNTLPLFNLAWYPSLFWDGRAVSIEEQVFHPVRAHDEMNLQWQVAVQRIGRNPFYKKKLAAAFGSEPIDSVAIAKAIAQFERTILSYRSKYDRVLNGKAYFTKDEFEGFELVNDMTKGACLHCHSTDGDALGTVPGYSNNGLDTASGIQSFRDRGRERITGAAEDAGKFKIPSLRNLAFTAPYMHDGRFKTLEEVIDFYSEGVKHSVTVDSKMEFSHRGGSYLTPEEKRKIIAFLLTMTDSALVQDLAFSNPFAKEKQ